MRVSANGGTPDLVIPAKEGEQVDGPQLLPDGDSVLFSVTTASGDTRWDAAQIVVQSLSNQTRKVIVQGGSDARYLPTGHLVYALGDALFAVAFDVGRLEVTGGPVSVVEGVARAGNPTLNTAAANYAVSEGGMLVYVSGSSFTQVAVTVAHPGVGGPTGPRRAVGRTAPTATSIRASLPTGSRLALDIRDPQEQDIWIWDLRRQTMTPLTFTPAWMAYRFGAPMGDGWCGPHSGRAQRSTSIGRRQMAPGPLNG